MIVKNSLNAYKYPVEHETTDKKSMTRPDMAMTVKEMLYKSGNGMPFSVAVRPEYYDETDTSPDIERLDNIDRAELLGRYAKELEDFKRRQAKRKAENDAKRAEREAFEQQVKDYHQKLQNSKTEPKKGDSEDSPKTE